MSLGFVLLGREAVKKQATAISKFEVGGWRWTDSRRSDTCFFFLRVKMRRGVTKT